MYLHSYVFDQTFGWWKGLTTTKIIKLYGNNFIKSQFEFVIFVVSVAAWETEEICKMLPFRFCAR